MLLQIHSLGYHLTKTAWVANFFFLLNS
jgi:hypothetical protein